jgi:histidinol-phosphate phosphatase family protein
MRVQVKNKAVFLDRDGTLNEDPGYLDDASKLKLLPGVAPALARLIEAGFTLVVVSNQSGVRRGLIQEGSLKLIHERLNALLGKPYPMIRHFRLCIHHPDDDCECRKPKPKLLLEAARDLRLDLSRSFMIGDKFSDVQVGKNAGCRASILVRTGEGETTAAKLKPGEADYVAPGLGEAVDWILHQS